MEGVPPVWGPPQTDPVLKPDTGGRYVDQNADRTPGSPLQVGEGRRDDAVFDSRLCFIRHAKSIALLALAQLFAAIRSRRVKISWNLLRSRNMYTLTMQRPAADTPILVNSR